MSLLEIVKHFFNKFYTLEKERESFKESYHISLMYVIIVT